MHNFAPMISKDSIETAYSFFHQKLRVYQYSNMEWQREDIVYAIGSYVEQMNRELLDELSHGRTDYLTAHESFGKDLTEAVERLEQML